MTKLKNVSIEASQLLFHVSKRAESTIVGCPFNWLFINFNEFCIGKLEMFMKGFLGFQVEEQHKRAIQEYMVNNLEDYERTVPETLSEGIF